MKQRQRKFIGVFATVAFMIVYSLVAMAIGGEIAVGRSAIVEIGFYLLAGIAWLPVVMWIIRWMARADTAPD
jgi:ABC-type multidrug transport system permease subunit